jgi:ABC-type transport system involved in multi-copper enzyme maturation permease subunit
MSSFPKTSFFSPSRVSIIAASTVTQLVRMKVFLFLAPVALLFVALNFFELPIYQGPDTLVPEQQLRTHKNLCLGTMMFFTSLFAIVSVALIIPSDVEDRTLYTILCKPVPRLDYLAGKLLGVILVLLMAMLVMDFLLVVTLHHRTTSISTDFGRYLSDLGFQEAEVARGQAELAKHGPTWVLQYGVMAHFFKACILAAVALLISTFSTSTLFTIAAGVMVWIIGAFQSIARDGLFVDSFAGETPSLADKILSTIISLIFPDFQLFESIADASVRAQEILGDDILKLGGLTLIYLAIYTVLSWFVFADKEF